VVEEFHELDERGVVGLLISIRKFGDVTILDLRGRSTFNDGERELLSSRLEELVANGDRKLLLNLSDLTQIDSSGVSIIVGTYVFLKREAGASNYYAPRPGARGVDCVSPTNHYSKL